MIRRLLRWLKAEWVMDYNPAWDSPPDLIAPLVRDIGQVNRELVAQANRPHYSRDAERVDFLLDMRSALGAAPADGELLRERTSERAS